MLPGAERDHRLNREGHARSHDGVVARIVVVEHLDVRVKLFADAVADECPYDTKLVLLGARLNRLSDVTQRTARNNRLNSSPHALFSDANEMRVLIGDCPDGKGCIGVTVNPVDVASDVQIDDVAILENP